jgi:hypothetical protein
LSYISVSSSRDSGRPQQRDNHDSIYVIIVSIRYLPLGKQELYRRRRRYSLGESKVKSANSGLRYQKVLLLRCELGGNKIRSSQFSGYPERPKCFLSKIADGNSVDLTSNTHKEEANCLT